MSCQVIRFTVIDGLVFVYDVFISSDGKEVLGMFDCLKENEEPSESGTDPDWDGKRPVHTRYRAEEPGFVDIEYKP